MQHLLHRDGIDVVGPAAGALQLGGGEAALCHVVLDREGAEQVRAGEAVLQLTRLAEEAEKV